VARRDITKHSLRAEAETGVRQKKNSGATAILLRTEYSDNSLGKATMNVQVFNEAQQQALLDLLILAMYADGHLGSAEDDRVRRLLAAQGQTAEYDQNKHYDAAVTRVSRHSQTQAAARKYASSLAQNFSKPDHKRSALEVIEDLLGSDAGVSAPENKFLSVLRGVLKV
jgi:hypothetical protein